MTNRLRQITAAMAALALASCGGGGGDDPITDTTVASVAVTGATTVAPGSTAQLTATAKNAGGVALPGLTATWSSSANNIATVNGSGLVTGVATGAVSITATISGVAGQRNLTVQPVTVVPSATVTAEGTSFTPQQVDISVNGQVTWDFKGLDDHNVTFGSTSGSPSNVPDTHGTTVTRTFGTTGTFNYTCTRHAGMTGTVVVH